MNRIEEEWHQKTHEIAGRMFEDEYDLAIAVILEARSKKVDTHWNVLSLILASYLIRIFSNWHQRGK